MNAIPIQKVGLAAIRDVIARALSDDLNASMLADFLASVDWSHMETASPDIRELLGTMEHWDTEFVEDDLSEAEYSDRLRSVLSGAYPVAV